MGKKKGLVCSVLCSPATKSSSTRPQQVVKLIPKGFGESSGSGDSVRFWAIYIDWKELGTSVKLPQLRRASSLNTEAESRGDWRASWLGRGELLRKFNHAMASRGRRGVPAREDDQRREERVEQQAPTPQGPTVLPPPPPVDYGVFMQGLVQAMQTHAHTQASLQAHLEAQAQALALVPQGHDHGGPSIMERFKRMAPPSFKWESDPLLAESWMREIEKIFRAIRCAEEDKVSLATCMLQVDTGSSQVDTRDLSQGIVLPV
ncbi:hypothetical protein Taro_027438 [Colocasia esculenta]|uniref:Uncharacterized protein n=1 Tax=Colocasia esculenta TaxID=4460 RepID=A0A843VRJ3_COLES|nr:hypothetical protein [Colocasia esculenta]